MAIKDKPGPWSDLFDPFFMNHVCERVREAIASGTAVADLRRPPKVPREEWERLFAERRKGWVRPAAPAPELGFIAKHLRNDLIAPLWAYVDAYRDPGGGSNGVHVIAAHALIERIESIAERFDDGFPPDESAADSLRLAWLEFIAWGAGYFMYWRVPREHAQRVSAPKGKRRGWSQYISAADVAQVRAEALATYEDEIAALCDRARRNVPADMRPPSGEPDAAAKRAYASAKDAGLIRPRTPKSPL